MELAVTSTPFGAFEDQRWMDNTEGLKRPLPGTLDGSLFTAGNFPNGVIPSGTCLGQVTSGSKYGPYDDTASDGRQTMVGHLIDTSLVGAARPGVGAGFDSVTIFREGDVISNKLPIASGAGSLDTAGKTDVSGHINYRTV